MASHDKLIKEMTMVDKMSTAERYEYAKRRRREQLERYFAAVGNGQTTTDHNGQRSNNNNYNSRGLKITFKPDIILLDSAARNDIDEVRQLLEAKVNPNVANCDGLTALHQAVIDNCLEMCQLLINFGADVNALDKESWSPLHAACMCGHVDIAKLLIDNDADVVALNIDGLMPCDMAEDEPMVFYIDEVMESKGLNEESVMAIRNRAADQMLDDIKDAVRSGRDLEVTDEHGATALHIACANGYYDVAEYLLKNGAKVDKKDKDGWEPIHAAACWGQDGVLELLVKYGANVDAETNNYERPFDLSEDPDTKRLLTLLKRKAEQQLFARRSSSTSRPRSNSRSQAIKRLSISEKSKVSYSEAVAEAKLRSEALIRTDVSEDTERNRRNQEQPASKQSDSAIDLGTINPAIDKPKDDKTSTEGASKKNTQGASKKNTQEASETAESSNHRNIAPQETPDHRPTPAAPDPPSQKSNIDDKKSKDKGCCIVL